jgi:thiosulfate/3-mercaptopyruvate sulfurtransferase
MDLCRERPYSSSVELPDIVVTPEWLLGQLARNSGRPTASRSPTRWKPGASVRESFVQGHLLGAGRSTSTSTSHARRSTAPAAIRCRRQKPSRIRWSGGIGDDDLVVAYDDAGGSVAARLWWMLHVTGQSRRVARPAVARDMDGDRRRSATGEGSPSPSPPDSVRDPGALERIADAEDVRVI